jgi:hypothetical protein
MSRWGKGFLPMLIVAAFTGCSSTQDVLQPTAPEVAAASNPPASTPAPADPATGAAAAPSVSGQSATPAAQGTIDPAKVARARIQFAPIVGTSVEAATALSERLSLRAKDRGMRLTGTGDIATTHVLKGYFTPLTEGKQTTVIYVWDVYDPAGTRVHRISGQQKAVSSGGEGWAGVQPDTMRQIADATIDQFAQWISAAP